MCKETKEQIQTVALEFAQQTDADGSPTFWESQESEYGLIYAVNDAPYPAPDKTRYVLNIDNGVNLTYQQAKEAVQELVEFLEAHPPQSVRPYHAPRRSQPAPALDGSGDTRWVTRAKSVNGLTVYASAEPEDYYANRHYWVNIVQPPAGYSLEQLKRVSSLLASFTQQAEEEVSEWVERTSIPDRTA